MYLPVKTRLVQEPWVIFGVESLKSLKVQQNLLLKYLQLNTRVENVRLLSWRTFFVGRYGFQNINKMAFKITVTSREFFISRNQIWNAHVIVVQRTHACASKMPSCSKLLITLPTNRSRQPRQLSSAWHMLMSIPINNCSTAACAN